MNDENPQESPPGGYDGNPPTERLPTYQPPPPGSSYPAAPQWATSAQPSVVRWRLRDHLTVAIIVAVVMIVIVGAGVMWISGSVKVEKAADQSTSQNTNAAQNVQRPEPAGANGMDLRKGAVFVHSNDKQQNMVVAYARAADGTLHEVGRYPTGGQGSGSIEDISDSLIIASPDGTVSPQHVSDNPEFLIAPNLHSGSVTVFRIKSNGLELTSTTVTGGLKPISLTVSHGLLYVLQSGETTDQFLTGPLSAIENCTTGTLPSITGFRLSGDGKLTAIPGSTRLLSGVQNSGCAQIGFTPDGKHLYATERIANKVDHATGNNLGAIVSWGVHSDGTVDVDPTINTPAGDGPFGFTFSKDSSTMYAVNQNGATNNPNGGQVRSYSVDPDTGTLAPLGAGPVPTHGTDSCWIAVTDDQKLAFVSSPPAPSGIASYKVNKDGSMTLLYPQATSQDGNSAEGNHLAQGTFDVALSHDNQYLYAMNGIEGDVSTFKVNGNGSLTYIQKVHSFDVVPFDLGGQGGPNGLAVY
jgi:6-phosphogluconolactonase (cycloisomerase 2 family)